MTTYRVKFSGGYVVTRDMPTEGGPVRAQDEAVRLALNVVREALLGAGFKFLDGAAVSFHSTPLKVKSKRVRARVVKPGPADLAPIIRIGEVLDGK